MAGIYVHIPFCASRCNYCAFYSNANMSHDTQKAYADSIIEELTARRNEIYDTVSTIYFGGGTPSQLTTELLGKLLDTITHNYNIAPEPEITIECNPEDLSRQYLAALHSIGFNRLSMGVQTFDNSLLTLLHRRHDSLRAQQAVHDAQHAGFNNITIDLMYGLPEQTEELLRKDINTAISLPIKHLSAYCLTYEPHTALDTLRRQGSVIETDDDTLNNYYDILVDTLAKAGFEQYETSNFAIHGYHSRHNSAYWTGGQYLGVGAAAHSYDGQRTRRWNISDIKRYMQRDRWYDGEVLTDNELYDEMVMLSLRQICGINLKQMSERFGTHMTQQCLTKAQQYISAGKLLHEAECLRVSHEGMKILDMITATLMA